MNSWSVIVPVKPWTQAKSRLDLPRHARRLLARAFCADVIATLAGSPGVGHTIVVSEDVPLDLPGDGVEFVRERPGGGGLNSAVRWAANRVEALGADQPVLVMPADLPCASAEDLREGLRRLGSLLSEHPRLYVRDSAGDGTTLLACARPSLLAPQYGPKSAAGHDAAGFVSVSGMPAGLTRDVDTVDDLIEAWRLGVRPHTYAAGTALSRAGLPLGLEPGTTRKDLP